MAEVGSGGVGALQELENSVPRRRGPAGCLVRQNELVEFGAIGCAIGANACIRQPRRLSVGVGMEDGLAKAAIARPEATAADFMRIGFASYTVGDGWRPRMGRRTATGKARDRHIKAAPEEM